MQFNIETKLDPTLPKETVAPGVFARKVIDVIKRHKLTKRSVIQSFDWRTLEEARALLPSLRRVALAQKSTIYKGTPWTAGIAIGVEAVRGRLAARWSSRTTCARMSSRPTSTT